MCGGSGFVCVLLLGFLLVIMRDCLREFVIRSVICLAVELISVGLDGQVMLSVWDVSVLNKVQLVFWAVYLVGLGVGGECCVLMFIVKITGMWSDCRAGSV